jgi:hypothetical protein
MFEGKEGQMGATTERHPVDELPLGRMTGYGLQHVLLLDIFGGGRAGGASERPQTSQSASRA